MTAVALADAGMRVVSVGCPCVPVVTEDISRLEGRFKCRTRRAETAGRAGLVINSLFRAGRAGFQILRFRNFRREIMQLKDRLDGHIACRHDEAATVQHDIWILRLPVLEMAVLGRHGGQGDLGALRCACGRCKCRAIPYGHDRDAILLRGWAADEIQPLIVPVLNMGTGIIRCEVICVIRSISVGKRHGITCICSRHADGRAGGHSAADGQRLAGRKIYVVCLAGDGIAGHDGSTAELQLPVVAGVDVNSAAISNRRISADRTIGQITDRTGAVDVHAAAAAGGRIAGDLTARHVQRRRLLIQIDRAAVSAGVSGELAAGKVEGAVCVGHMDRAALRIRLVAAERAAGHVERCLLIRILAQADRAAPAACGIAGEPCAAGNGDRAPAHEDRAAVQAGRIAADLCAAGNVDRAAAAHIDGAAAGVVAAHGRFIAGDRTALQIDGAAGGGEERTAVLCRVILDDAAVHVEGTASGVRLIRIELPENSAAIVVAVVAGDLTAVHAEHALLVIQSNGSASAAFGNLSAGELAAEHIHPAGVKIDAGAAPDIFRRALDGAAASTVAEDEPGIVSHLELLFPVGGQRLAVQAQIQGLAIDDQIAVKGSVPRQVDVGRIVGIGNAARAIPRCVGHVGMAGMVARKDGAAAEAVHMLAFRVHGSVRFLRHFRLFECRLFHLPGVKRAVLRTRILRTAGRTVCIPVFLRAFHRADAGERLLVHMFMRFLGKGRRGQKRQQHTEKEQNAEQSFFHIFLAFISRPSRTPWEKPVQGAVHEALSVQGRTSFSPITSPVP